MLTHVHPVGEISYQPVAHYLKDYLRLALKLKIFNDTDVVVTPGEVVWLSWKQIFLYACVFACLWRVHGWLVKEGVHAHFLFYLSGRTYGQKYAASSI